MKLRLAAIEFLNAAPLMWGLDQDPGIETFFTVPSACATALREGTADLGVIPVIELARIPGLAGIPGIGVTARRQVRSILLISKVPPPQIRSLRLDRSSRTSAALVQILLHEHWGAAFTTAAALPSWRDMLREADAALIIGDPALRLRVSGEPEREGLEVYDLATVWHQWTGLPFVFALWGIRRAAVEALRREQPQREQPQKVEAWLVRRLLQAKQEGVAHREDLVRLWAPRLQLSEDEVRRYLEHDVEYDLLPEHHRAIQLYFDLATRHGLLETPRLPEFYSCS